MALYSCPICEKTFRAKPSENRRFCSPKCAGRYVKAQPREARFWAHVDRTGSCWSWVGGRTKNGYGNFWNGVYLELAHRYAYRTFVGPIAEGMNVCHRCDNPSCVRPSHLFAGTPAQNTADMMRKGRFVLGARNPLFGEAHQNHKLTSEDVRTIRARRASGEVLRTIAASFGVAETTISKIARGATRIND